MNAHEIVTTARKAFNSGKTKSYEFRKSQLEALLKLFEENEALMIEALEIDLKKHKSESVVSEVEYLKNDVRGTLYNLKEWMKPEYVEKSLPNIMDKVLIHHEPYGVVLIISAWNYPIQLCLAPLTGAIAAGNCAVIKPSEIAEASAKLIAELIPKYLDVECYKVYTGGVKQTSEILKEKFDYIFYTGSTEVGKIVHQAANKHLTPVTLELGGKSPVFIDETADLDVTAKRVIWGKCLNAGQTCIAPDYVLCTKELQEKFTEKAKKVIEDFYGKDAKNSPDFPRIINSNHMNRLVKLLEGSKIAYGGQYDLSEKYLQPTILTDVSPNSAVMKNEIFGPILPIVTVKNSLEAIEFINDREKPLALYVFSNDTKTVDLFMKNTSSGNFLANDTIVHFAVDTLPFGGVGNSGIGAYHGKFSFDTFTHKKGTLIKDLSKLGEMMQSIRYPPYSNQKLGLMVNLTKKRMPIPGQKYIKPVVIFGLGVFVTLISKFMCTFTDSNKNK